MKEEAITLAVVNFLKSKGFVIIAFDYPGSGSGLRLSPEERGSKNNGMIPDIIACCGAILIIIESKPTFVLDDVNKLQPLRDGTDYFKALQRLMQLSNTHVILYGVCFEHNDRQNAKANNYKDKLDFVLTVSADMTVRTLFANERLQVVL